MECRGRGCFQHVRRLGGALRGGRAKRLRKRAVRRERRCTHLASLADCTADLTESDFSNCHSHRGTTQRHCNSALRRPLRRRPSQPPRGAAQARRPAGARAVQSASAPSEAIDIHFCGHTPLYLQLQYVRKNKKEQHFEKLESKTKPLNSAIDAVSRGGPHEPQFTFPESTRVPRGPQRPAAARAGSPRRPPCGCTPRQGPAGFCTI